ncbi:MerR family transcriptional regulator [Modestobacter muralis]|uniref:MerR family transcriptional regulator n=2 Tax=Modestobacter muralis TaxID=1608614 RepID=A0A6P0HC79_9ACTN|nr:MerR family transcriptional regulator [Modestobacter muralis]NEN53180.1 MerR family transcriptional regulator [Modestobacter muralis]
MSWTVGELARLTGVTVRTLHHYRKDPAAPHHSQARGGPLQWGRPAASDSGCGSSARLQGPAPSSRGMGGRRVLRLRRQHRLLRDRLEATSAMVAAVEKEMEARQMGISLTPEERFEVFGDWLPEEYAAEAEERWGDTEVWAQSQRRTAAMTKEDWLRVKAETDDLEGRFAAALAAGTPADDPGPMDVAEEHRQHITRWFYDCPPGMHAGLGEMYVADERFTAYYERIAPGLAQYVSTAVRANAARQGG